MKRVLVSVAFACTAVCALWAGVAESPRVRRVALEKLENRLDLFLTKSPDPCQLLGNTRGVYLEGYGAVFTTMVALVPTPIPSPFRDFTPKDVDDVHVRKVHQLPIMRVKMQNMLLLLASDPALDSVRPKEQIVCGVTFFYYKQWENMTGLPAQIVMQAEKQQLLDVESGRIPRSQLDSLIKMQEL